MASFRSLIDDAHNVDVGALKLAIKDGIVQLDDLAEDVRATAEAELHRLGELFEVVKDEVVKAVSPKPTTTPAPDAPKE